MRRCVNVVGVTFEGRQEAIRRMHEGNVIVLSHEADNQFDPNAVGVWWNGLKIGYLARELAAEVAPLCGNGVLFGTVEKIKRFGGEFSTMGVTIEFEIGDGA